MTLRWPVVSVLALGGCFNLDATPMPEGEIAFAPETGAPDGWVVKSFTMDGFECPDGLEPEFYVVHPVDAAGPVPVAVVLHSGAFDYVNGASAADPLSGPSFQDPLRLTRSWALRRVFVTLGMYPDDDRFERHTGAIATALADHGVAMILPPNCWGDLWHNQPGAADNDITADGFERNGRAAAVWAWRMATEDGFWPANYKTAPVDFDETRAYMVGIGDGSRGVGELLTQGYTPASVIVDSPIDDVRAYYIDTGLHAATIQGLERIFPGGQDTMVTGALGWAPSYPTRSAFVYSSLDSQVPAGANDRILNRLAGLPDAFVYDGAVSYHVITGADLTAATNAVSWMVDG